MDAGVFILTLAGALRAIGVTSLRTDLKPLRAACVAAFKAAKEARIGVTFPLKSARDLGERLCPTLLDFKLGQRSQTDNNVVELSFSTAAIAEFYMREVCQGIDTEKMKQVARVFLHAYERTKP